MTKEILEKELKKVKESLEKIEQVFHQLKGQELLLLKLIEDEETSSKK